MEYKQFPTGKKVLNKYACCLRQMTPNTGPEMLCQETLSRQKILSPVLFKLRMKKVGLKSMLSFKIQITLNNRYF